MFGDPKRRLDSWKEIADYLRRDVRTVIRWEKQRQLPVHRIPGGKRHTVFAFTDEIDAWMTRERGPYPVTSVTSSNESIVREVQSPGDSNFRAPEEMEAPRAASAGAATLPAAGSSSLIRPLIAIPLIAAGILVAAIGSGRLRRPSPAPAVSMCVPLTLDGAAKAGDLVTDGRRLYFTELTDAGRMVMQVSVNGGQPKPVSPYWTGFELLDISPGGAELLARSSGNTGADAPLWVLPLPAGLPRRLGLEAQSAAFSPDGARLAFFRDGVLYLANREGGEPRKLISVGGAPRRLRWSPDGATLRFDLRDAKGSSAKLWEVPTSRPGIRPVPITAGSAPSQSFFGNWSPDGDYFLFHAGSVTGSDLWIQREKRNLLQPGGLPVRLTAGANNFTESVWSRDGKKIFSLGEVSHGELVRYDSGSRRFVPYLGGIAASGIAFSPDGKEAVYTQGQDLTLWRSASDGSRPLQLTPPSLQAIMARWSPDGRSIAFVGNGVIAMGRPRIYLVSPFGGSPEEIMPDDSDQANPTWSPDGTRLAFAGAPWLRGFRPESTSVRVIDLSSHEVSTLPESQGLWAPKWSPDGRTILAETIDSTALVLFDIAARKWRALKLVNKPIGYPCWSHDGRYVYFNTSPPDSTVYRVRVRDGAMETVLSLKNIRTTGPVDAWFGLTPDDSPLVVRDTVVQEIYALSVVFP
jgi:Tol biopolymer transport system component